MEATTSRHRKHETGTSLRRIGKAKGKAKQAKPTTDIRPLDKLLLSYRDLVALTGLCRATLFKEVQRGRLAAISYGRRTLFKIDDVKKFIQELEKAA